MTPAAVVDDTDSIAAQPAAAAIPLFKVHMPETVLGPLAETIASGYLGQGPRVNEFEAALTPWFGSERVLTVNSATSGLQLALRLANVQAGDEVISTPMTCSATNVPIMAAGAKIVWADINPHTGNIDPNDVARKITERTRAIVAVHWGGYPCDLDELNAIARERDIKLIEDAAHAFGATYKGAPIGSHSDFVNFSFQAIKHMTTGDGGALVCRDNASYERGKLLRWYGIDREGKRTDFRCEEDIVEWGYKFHMNDIAATIGLHQLKFVAQTLRRHRENAAYYRERLRGLRGFQLLDHRLDREGAYWLFTARVRERQQFIDSMKKAGVTTSQVHSRNDLHTTFAEFRSELPGVTEFAAEQVSIPVGWWVTDSEREHIAETVARLCE